MVVGTRPEAIKLAPVAAALAERGLAPRLVLTGQHPVDPAGFAAAPGPVIALDLPGTADPRAHAAAVARLIGPHVAKHRPDLLMVQGDTSSALGGALAAEEAGIPLAHVEAGLRSFDPAMPWPEEDNRVAIDARSDLLFAPTETAAANLAAEQLSGAVHVTGNSGIDALLQLLHAMPAPAPRPEHSRLRLLATCHRRENWGGGIAAVARALVRLARGGRLAITIVLHPNPAAGEAMRLLIGGQPAIRLLDPLDHPAMVAAMRGSDIILSDSGGMQEEAPALGVPMLVLRDKTERPEGIASGNLQLVGTDEERIVAAVGRLVDDPAERGRMSRPALPYGDGRAGQRIAGLIDEWLADRSALPRRLTA